MFQVGAVWWLVGFAGGEHRGLDSGLFLMVSTVPAVALAPVVARIVARHAHRTVLAGAAAVAGAVSVTAAVLARAESLPLAAAYAVGLALAACQAVFDPCLTTSVPELVEDADIESATGFELSTQSVAGLCGGLLGPLVVDAGALAGVTAVCGTAYLSAAVLIGATRFSHQGVGDGPARERRTLRRVLAGLPFIRRVLICFAAANIFTTAVYVVMPLYTQEVLHATGSTVASLETALGAGTLLGSFTGGRLPGRPVPVGSVCLAVMAAALALPGMFAGHTAALASMAVVELVRGRDRRTVRRAVPASGARRRQTGLLRRHAGRARGHVPRVLARVRRTGRPSERRDAVSGAGRGTRAGRAGPVVARQPRGRRRGEQTGRTGAGTGGTRLVTAVLSPASVQDIAELRQLYFDVYGHGYPVPLGSDPVVMRGLITGGCAHWLTARAPGGDLVGSAVVLTEPGNRIGKLVGLAVHPAHRGTGLASRLTGAVCDEAFGTGLLDSVYATVRLVTEGPQQVVVRNGFRPLGLLPNAVEVEGCETLALFARYADGVLERRVPVTSVPERLSALLSAASRGVRIDYARTRSAPCRAAAAAEAAPIELIAAPAFVRRRFLELFPTADDRFFPLHTPNAVVVATDGRFEAYADLDPVAGSCALVAVHPRPPRWRERWRR
ncbi:MFS transporter [Streptomyces lasalocidi]